MAGVLKKLIITILVIGVLIAAGYGAYQVYLFGIEDATRRIKEGVTQGVQEGVGKGMKKGIGNVINPFKWF